MHILLAVLIKSNSFLYPFITTLLSCRFRIHVDIHPILTAFLHVTVLYETIEVNCYEHFCKENKDHTIISHFISIRMSSNFEVELKRIFFRHLSCMFSAADSHTVGPGFEPRHGCSALNIRSKQVPVPLRTWGGGSA